MANLLKGKQIQTQTIILSGNTGHVLVSGDLDMGTNSVILSNLPTADNQAANKAYVDAMSNGLKPHAPVIVVSTSAVTSLSGVTTIDTIEIIEGNRVLLTNQGNTGIGDSNVSNGLWIAHSGSTGWSRPDDADGSTTSEVSLGDFVFVEQGSVNASSGWVLAGTDGNADNNIIPNVESQKWVKMAAPGAFSADGQGIELNGNIFSLEIDGTSLSKSGSGLRVSSGYTTSIETAISTGDNSLSTALSTEISTRGSADSSLSTNISNSLTGVTSLDTALSTEISTRGSADTSLSTDISNSLTGITSLTTAVSTEVSTRTSVDTSLSTEISTEILNRISGDTSLSIAINNNKIYANNGLVVNNQNVGLGGSLTGNTNIDLNNNILEIINNNIGFISDTGFNSYVNTITEQTDGKILVGGNFTSYSGVTSNYIIRLNTDGSIDNTFITDIGFNSEIYSIVEQTDGKILIGGFFTAYSGVTANYIIRLNTDGSIDNSFVSDTGFNTYVNTITLQSDEKILVGGYFATYSGVTANRIIRLNTDGSIDNTFISDTGFDSYVNAITEQTDGKILVGGNFTSYSGVTVNYIIRLNTDGSIDNSFVSDTGFDNYVKSIIQQTDGKILVGGNFTSYSGVTANRIIRLNSNGSIDNSFVSDTGFDNYVNTLAIQTDGKILIGGYFAAYSGVTTNYIIRLNSNGSIDNSFIFDTGLDSEIYTIIEQTNGKILVGGDFSIYSGQTANYIIRLNTDGFIDTNNTYNIIFNGKTIEYGSDISIYYTNRSLVDKEYVDNITSGISGVTSLSTALSTEISTRDSADTSLSTDISNSLTGITSLDNALSTEISTRDSADSSLSTNISNSLTGITSLDNALSTEISTRGSADTSLSTAINNTITGATNGLVKNNQYVGLGGSLTGNTTIDLNNKILKIINNRFVSDTGFNSAVNTIAIQTDGKILAGGFFTSYSGVTANRIIRLNSNGSIDNSFVSDTGFNADVNTIALQTDGKILVGGYFRTFSGQTANYIIRLNSNGSIDNTFVSDTGFDGNGVNNITLQTDGKILVGGDFLSYSGVTVSNIIRLNSNGSIDDSFVYGTGFNSAVNSITEQTDGKILVGGVFTSYSGVTANRIIRLNSGGTIDNSFVYGTGFNNNVNSITEQIDGKILVGGNFSTYSGVTANNIIRLNSGGTIDNSFVYGTGFNNDVNAILLQTDGKILVGGNFSTYSGVTSNYIVRLNSGGTIDNSFNIGTGFNSLVKSIILQTNGKILVGGYFASYNEVTAKYIIKLNSDGTIENYNINFNGKVIEYGSDYSDDYTNRSLVDKEYVDNITSSISGITSLSTGLSTEISSRTSSDTSLSTALSTEISTRDSADMSLSTNISNSVTGITSLNTAISTEISTRDSADTSLSTAINSVKTDVYTQSFLAPLSGSTSSMIVSNSAFTFATGTIDVDSISIHLNGIQYSYATAQGTAVFYTSGTPTGAGQTLYFDGVTADFAIETDDVVKVIYTVKG